ncbi:MAG: NDP-sugar synthase [Phycisphaerae bacterium]
MSSAQGNSVRGIILAGVHRWDKFSFDGIMPRSLVPIGHWPLISFVMEWFREAGIQEATICANSASLMVRKGLGDGSPFGMKLDYYEDWVPRGPAGCVRDAGNRSDAEVFVVADASTIPQLDMADLLAAHKASGAVMTAVLSREPQKGEYTPETCLTPTGIYVFGRQVLDFIRETGYQDIKEVLIPRLHDCGHRVRGYVVEEPCLRVTDAWSYLAANEKVAQQISEQNEDLPEYSRIGEGYIHRTAQYSADVKFIGPVLVGRGTRIGREATIIGPTVIGAQCEIGKGTIVGRCVLWDQSVIGEHCRLDGCLLTTGAAVPSRTTLTRAIHQSTVRERASLMSRLASKLSGISRQHEGTAVKSISESESLYLGSVRPPQARTGRAVGTTSL